MLTGMKYISILIFLHTLCSYTTFEKFLEIINAP
jgi:hypothetical protein